MTTQLVGPEVPRIEGHLEQPDAPSIALLARVLGQSATGLALGVPLADAERVDRLAALEDLKAAAAAAQALLASELDTSRRMAEAARGVPAAEQGRAVAHEVALARRESPHAGGRLLGLGKALVREMPHTLAALRSGAISEWRATLLVRETACLTREDRATVDRELAGTPEAAAELGRKGARAIVAAAQRVACRLDPQAVVDRSSRAARDRHVSLRPAPDCMARISALLPVAQGVATYAALKAQADAARSAGDPRTRGQVMADTLVARVTGQESADAVPVCVNLTLDADAFFGSGAGTADVSAPGAGSLGPVPAAIAARILGAAPEQGRWVRRLFTRPTSGQLVSAESRQRCFPAGIAQLVALVHPTCRTPWCDAPAVHTDHVVAHADGGATTLSNAQGLCEACNYAKSLPGWRASPVGEGMGPPIAVVTTTPTGHVHESGRGP
jgi:predicted transcriptional regulator